jgi:hypothetical protein
MVYDASGLGLSGEVRPVAGTNAVVSASNRLDAQMHGREEGMMRVAIAAMIALLLMASAGWAASSEKADSSPPPFEQWLPGESYSGGKEYDPRLDQPVRFWGAGIPLKQVFESIREQIGVEIGVWPPGDMNSRVCVTLYLNPDKTPSLRELMAQLAWVTDCAFARERTEAGGRYALLATSVGGSARETLLQERQETLARQRELREERRHQAAIENRARVRARLGELRSAFALPRDELARHYSGKDDHLLLALLEPGRRAIVAFALSLTEHDIGVLVDGAPVEYEWSSLSPDQRSLAETAFLRAHAGNWDTEEVRQQAASGMFDWDRDPSIRVFIGGIDSGGLGIWARLPDGETYTERPLVSAGARLVETGDPWLPEETIALRRALGEGMTEEQERQFIEQTDSQIELARRRQDADGVLERNPTTWGRLSMEAEGVLEALPLSEAEGRAVALWQVQEAVAMRSGYHVVSDCFWQPTRDLNSRQRFIHPDRAEQLSALLALRLSCAAWDDRYSLLWEREEGNEDAIAWEWGDAGPFLRFRSTSRDVWRASFLPESVLRAMTAWWEPQLTESCSSDASSEEIEIELDPRSVARVTSQIDDLDDIWGGFRVRYGGRLCYGDPSDVREAYATAARASLCEPLSAQRWGFRVFVGFTDEQWQRIRGEGLRWERDLRPEQQSEFLASHVPEEKRNDLTLRLQDNEGDYLLVFRSGGKTVLSAFLPRRVRVTLHKPTRLAPANPVAPGM